MSSALRQIVIADNVYLTMKQYCVNKKITLTVYYYEMLEWFIKYYGNASELLFQASLNRGKKLSLWIQEKQLLIIKKLAVQANVSDARVIYTAYMLYFNKVVLNEVHAV